ncbi:MAG: Uma2 family endonuclease [Dehalococcoidia bacterium]|nr:Uma2 family endonuclease [Dehalococcoidia bacterium]MYB50539.1 Uma2 family endonuclease [Dehalococcoidia bacterium]
MVTVIKKPATVADLYKVADGGKAELVKGELRLMAPTGLRPGFASSKIWLSLYQYVQAGHSGVAVGDNVGFIVDLPNRQSFSPDAAFFTGEDSGMKFAQGAPVFAVEIRSENDYGPAAEREMASKRADYFTAGTLVVWDVDLLSNDTVKVFRSSDPNTPTIYRRGETAEAEPAVPKWTMPVDELFA